MANIMTEVQFKELASKSAQVKASVLPPLYKQVSLVETDVDLSTLIKDQYNRREYTNHGITVRCGVDTTVASDATRVTVWHCEQAEDLEVTVRGKRVVYPKGLGVFRIYPAV